MFPPGLFWWCCGGCRRLLSLLGWLAGEDMAADGPRVRSVFLSLFANGVEIWLSPLVGFASGLHALWPASADPLSGLLVTISIAINCRFVLPSSRARDGRCYFRGIRCITAGVRLRSILRLVQGWKSLFQLEERFGSASSSVPRWRRSLERKTKLRTWLWGFDVFSSFLKVLSVKLGMYCAPI